MATQTLHRNSSKVRSPRHDCCAVECPSGSRNNYFLGKNVTAENLQFEQNYSIYRRRLINRAVHGWGVVYGFALWMLDENHSNLEPGEVGVGEGFAIDRHGRELIQTHQTTLALDNLLILDKHGQPLRADGNLDERFHGLRWAESDCWLLSAHYAEKKIGPITVRETCRCDREEWDQTCETVVYSLQQIDCEKCCATWDCELHCCCPPDAGCCAEDRRKHEECACEHEQAMREFEEQSAEIDDDGDPRYADLQREFEPRFHELAEREHAVAAKLHPRGGCSCLCDHLTGLKVGINCDHLSEIGDCTRADLAHGVPLACMKLGRDDCGNLSIATILDACGPRRLVKGNDLLFDLINGCDVTRIIETGWARWHRRRHAVPFDDFVRALGGENNVDADEVDTEDFWVRFSRPVREDTLTPEAFTMAVMSDQTEGCWREYYRVPIVAVRGSERKPEDPPGHVRRALIAVSGGWLSDGVLGSGSVFKHGQTYVEIGVRGDFIEDCLRQTVDANARGRSPVPSGSDGPGDTYISTFTVARRTREPKSEPRQGYRSRQRTTTAA